MVVAYLSLIAFASAEDSSLVGYWSFNEGEGSAVKDSSPFGNNGNIEGNPGWVKGKKGYALSFNAEEKKEGEKYDCVLIPSSESLNLTNEITVMAWFKVKKWNKEEKTKLHDVIIEKSGSWILQRDGGSACFRAWLTREGGDWNDRNNPFCSPMLKTAEVSLDDWYHLAFTYDKGLPEGNLKFYLNGELVDKKDWNERTIPITDSGIFIGKISHEACPFNGIIDEVKIYKKALTEKEIEEEYFKTR